MSLEERFLMMTGNNKVWRAPIAGLASAAMLATLGVSALTANAAEEPTEFTLDGNGLTFKTDKGDVDSITIKDSDNDKKLDADDLSAADVQLNDASAFTGWYTTPEYGVKDSAVQFDETENTTVYAHWSETQYQVTFNGNGVTLTEPTDNNTVKLASKDGVLDKVASWQVPTDGAYDDGHMLTGWTSAMNGAAVDPTDVSGILPNTGYVIPLQAASKDSTYVTFYAQDLWHQDRQVQLNGKAEDVNIETPLNEPFQGTVPTAAFVYADKTVAATQFVDNEDKKVVFNASDVVTGHTAWYPATLGAESYTVRFTTGDTEAGYSDAPETQMVEKGNKVSKPADPTLKDSDSYKYEFAGWYDTTSGKEYDFNTPVSGNLNLHAYFKVSEMKVTFDPNFAGSKVIEQWYGDGDTFEAPAAPERDGWIFATWMAPTNGTKLTLVSEPAANPTGDLTYIVSDGEDDVHKPTLDRLFTAQWTPLDDAEETLGELEGYVNVNLDQEEQKLYTAASYKQYVADFQDYLAKKAELAKGGYTKAEYSEMLQMLNGIQSKLVEVGHTNLYRVYNPNNGDHYFTTDKNEYEALVAMGWQAEGVRYQVVNINVNVTDDDANKDRLHAFGTEIWSVYNPNTGEHLLTEEGEADALAQVGWIKEDPKFYTVQNGSESVVRVYNPNTNGPAHLYTDASEANGLAKIGWSIDNNGAPVFTLD